MARRGRKRRLGLEDEYWKLMADGVGTVMACRQLGIGRKTGYRWRAESGGLAPQRDSEQMHSNDRPGSLGLSRSPFIVSSRGITSFSSFLIDRSSALLPARSREAWICSRTRASSESM